MQANDIPHWTDRIDAMDTFDGHFIDIIRGIQDEVWEEIINYFTRRVVRGEGNKISNVAENIVLVSGIDRIVASYLGGAGQRNVLKIGDEMDTLLGANKTYLRPQTNISDTLFNSIVQNARDYALTYIGFKLADLSIEAGSRLWDAIMDTRFTRTVKAILMNAVQTEAPVNRTVKEVDILGTTNRVKKGEYEKQVLNVLPNPGDVIENVYGLNNAIEMGLHFTRYQGGLIKTSRDFCIERNNKIFHVSEIAKFGTPEDKYNSYTNKSKGIFDGKTYIYNPFYDVGGFNCRHRYFYISNEYAYLLQPSLKDKNFELPDIFKQAA